MKTIKINTLLRAAISNTDANILTAEQITGAFKRIGADPDDFISSFNCDPLRMAQLASLSEKQELLLYHKLLAFIYDKEMQASDEIEIAMALLCGDREFAVLVIDALKSGLGIILNEAVTANEKSEQVKLRGSIIEELLSVIRHFRTASEMLTSFGWGGDTDDVKAVASRIAGQLSLAKSETGTFVEFILRYLNEDIETNLKRLDSLLQETDLSRFLPDERTHLRQELVRIAMEED